MPFPARRRKLLGTEPQAMLVLVVVLMDSVAGSPDDRQEKVLTDAQRPGDVPWFGNKGLRTTTPPPSFELISSSKITADTTWPADTLHSFDVEAVDHRYAYTFAADREPPTTKTPGSKIVFPSSEALADSNTLPPDVYITQKPPRDPFRDPLRDVATSNLQTIGPPMISTVVVQDMTRPTVSAIKNPAEIKVASDKDEITDKIQETDLYDYESNLTEEDEDDEDEDDHLITSEQLENPPNLDIGGIVEDALKEVFKNDKVYANKKAEKTSASSGSNFWPCRPVSCCQVHAGVRKCTTAMKCIEPGKRYKCPVTKAVNSRPPKGNSAAASQDLQGAASSISTIIGPNGEIIDGEPRFKKKKILKKKKKFLKKYMMPLLMGYKLLFLLVVPLMVNGMLMMISSSGMAGFLFALLGASVAMVRAYSGGSRIVKVPSPPPNRVLKVIKYVTLAPDNPTTTPAPTAPPTHPPSTMPPTIVHRPQYVDSYGPYLHHPPPLPYTPAYMPPYMPPLFYDRKRNFEGGRRRRRRKG